MTRIKVVHTANNDIAMRYLLLGQLRAIQEAGYEVLGASSGGPEIEAVERAGIRHFEVPITRSLLTPWTDLKSLIRLVRFFRRERVTIVHTHNPKPGILTAIAAWIAGVPIIIKTLHGFYFNDDTPFYLRRLYLFLEWVTARFTPVIFSQNRPDIEIALRHRVVRPGQMKYLGNGIDLTNFDPEQIDPQVLADKRKSIGLAEGRPVIGFVGRLVRDKGLMELFAAAQKIRKQRPDVQFLFVGPVDLHKRDAVSPEEARKFDIEPCSFFVGKRHDMSYMYALMDVFVLPSYREGFPRAPMEASAMGVPCVVTGIRGCTEAVEHNRNGLLVPLYDVDALAQALLYLLEHPAEARRMGETGKILARDRFDEKVVARTILAEYARLLGQKRIRVPGREEEMVSA